MPADVPELEPFYRPLDGAAGERFHATTSTTGPWFADAQHVGPPSALLVRALERCPSEASTQLSRITVEVLGPVPAGEVRVCAGIERPGRTVELLSAEMHAGGRTVLKARAWRLALGDTSDVAVGEAQPLPPPERGTPRQELPTGWLPGFMNCVEWRWLRGWFGEPGPGTTWGRLRVPLVEGEKPSPLQRLAVLADTANGAASPLDLTNWLFVNTELTMHLHRPPAGEWMAVAAETVLGPTGTGTVSGLLFDERGHTGRSAQSVVLRPR
ncbi:thioesterase family protein [Pseudonocardia alaniniphila]|uniref:Thioesterase family protein n=1 Tax=Pseudonocardia alaniniphila TaxID=75291 RepID=A0ABS9TGC1_9PSEU|nr:thioesterase family protein [Pseudonocardia alaniniphila]MCH6167587.1 thioesterase family protein [Pseudonocardia alaniniphila]